MAKKKGKKTPQKQWLKWVFEILLLLVWTGVSMVASQFVIGYLMVIICGSGVIDQPVATTIYLTLSYILTIFLVIFLPPKLLSKLKIRNAPRLANREELGLKGWPTWTDIGLAPVGFIVYFLLAAGLAAIFSNFGWFNASEAQELGYSNYIFGFDRLMAFIALVIVAPIAEEVIFRGWLYGKLRAKTSLFTTVVGSIIISTVLVSVLFGLIHWQWNVGINVFAMSVVLCLMREVTGTIYSGILLHMLKNGVAFYLLFMVGLF